MADYIKPQMVRIIHDKPDKTMTLQMVHLPKGEFMMGSELNDNEQPVHKVTIDDAFEIGKYPVTIGEYRTFAKDTRSHYPEWMEEGSYYNIKTGGSDYYKKISLDDNAPIVGVSWHDAKAYCNWLSKITGETYRLPTEAEWEYACRAEKTTMWSFGDDEKELGKYAWYRENSNSTTHPVGEKKPNPWGLYDMHGNVWEWCEDDWVDSYDKTPRDGSAYKDNESGSKVLRGGSWGSSADRARSAVRSWDGPGNRSGSSGFRLLRTLP